MAGTNMLTFGTRGPVRLAFLSAASFVVAMAMVVTAAGETKSMNFGDAMTPDEMRAAGRNVRQVFYWERKDLTTYLVLMQAMVNEMLDTADVLAAADEKPSEAAAYKRRAMGALYDIASLSWPGWAEEGIDPTPDQIATGLAAAKMNIRLGQDLGLGPQVRRNGYFVLGLQLLASGDGGAALDALREHKSLSEESGMDVGIDDGWVALAEVAAGVEGAERRYEATIESLRSAEGEAKQQGDYITRARTVLGLDG